MTRPRAADDFATIRARLDAPRRRARLSDSELRRRCEGLPPPWVPTIFDD